MFNPKKQEEIIKEGSFKNKPVIKDVPDMKQLKEYRNQQLKDGYYYSKIKFGLYKKISNTNLYYELENQYPQYFEKYEYKRKYYKVKKN